MGQQDRTAEYVTLTNRVGILGTQIARRISTVYPQHLYMLCGWNPFQQHPARMNQKWATVNNRKELQPSYQYVVKCNNNLPTNISTSLQFPMHYKVGNLLWHIILCCRLEGFYRSWWPSNSSFCKILNPRRIWFGESCYDGNRTVIVSEMTLNAS
jgi:hypothetical protein